MSNWALRDETGVLKLKMSPSAAGKFMEAVPGSWKTKNFKKTGVTSVYQIKEDMVFNIPSAGMEVLIWAGDYLSPISD